MMIVCADVSTPVTTRRAYIVSPLCTAITCFPKPFEVFPVLETVSRCCMHYSNVVKDLSFKAHSSALESPGYAHTAREQQESSSVQKSATTP